MGQKEILNIIVKNINEFVENTDLKETLSKIPDLSKKSIIINNSFFFRNKTYIKTNKNEKYLLFHATNSNITENDCFVIDGVKINKDYKLIDRGDSKITRKTKLKDAVNLELKNIGKLVFVLLGEIDDSNIIEKEINHDLIKKFILDPSKTDIASVNEDSIICKSLENEQMVWDEIQKGIEEYMLDEESIKNLKSELGSTFDDIKDEAYCNLKIPETIKNEKAYFLDTVYLSLKNNLNTYNKALEKISKAVADRKQAFNEILRIAYNFTDDAITLIRLLVSVGDLKPLVFWGSFFYQYLLVKSINNLPWEEQQTKASLKNYIDTIKKARNSKFHRLFPFSKPFEVSLPAKSLKNVKLRIFSQYGSRKNSNKIDYEDKELVDLLMEFTRSDEKTVTDEFWKRNAKIMENTINMVLQISELLKTCIDSGKTDFA